MKLFGKICSNFFFSTLFLIIFLFWGSKNLFSTNFRKIRWSFAENKIYEKSKMAAKMEDILWKGCCHSNSS